MKARFGIPSVLLGLVAAFGAASSVHCAAGHVQAPDLDASDLPPLEAAAPPPTGAFTEAGAPPLTADCAESTKQIYVLGTDKTLYRFYPDTLTFLRIGTIACPSEAGTFSMAIDRRGTAWVEYTDGQLFAVDTTDASCKPTAFRAGQTGFQVFGMGYARNDDSPTNETLYVAGDGLAWLDTTSFTLNYLGSLAAGRTELTGRDNELFAFNVVSGVVAGVNKSTGASIVTYRTTAVDAAAAFAFAQWGGDFWIFTGDDRSIVTRYSPDKNTSSVVVADTGMLIVGAGSSTCAPTKPN